jgi:hypothetical protein
MKHLFCLLSIFILSNVHAQYQLHGSIVVSGAGTPVAGASVFLSNTSVGTTSNDSGYFVLNIPAGKYDLIISSVGFERYVSTLTSVPAGPFKVSLQRKSGQLQDVVVSSFEKDGWSKWGKFFLESFIGTSAFAKDCVIKNTHDVRFRHDGIAKKLNAVAYEPLIIENKSLGYTIIYEMQNFEFDFKNNYLVYVGYPLFKEMDGSKRQQQRWQKNRQDAYEGSMTHFMRALFRNQLSEAGFEIRHCMRIKNVEKERVKAVRKKQVISNMALNGTLSMQSGHPDSTRYYEKILRQSDFITLLDSAQLRADSIAYAIDSVTVGLDFKDYLDVLYTKKLVDDAYLRIFPGNGKSQISQVFLANTRPIQVLGNGTYFPPQELLSLGYWAWSEKIATMLPYDYKAGVVSK